MKQKLIVIGNGMAGMRTVEEILKRDADHYDITVFGAEARENYNRIMLSPVLSGEKSFEDIIINSREWYVENDITLFAGDAVTAIDTSAKTVTSARGLTLGYDKLVLATGSDPFIIPVPGKDLEGVVTFRDLDDVNRMLDAAKLGGRAIVIGGGLLGLEAAVGLKANGMDVTVVHLMDTLMERQLDEAAGYLLVSELEGRGLQVLTGANTKAILGDTKVTGLELVDGTQLKADLVVMAVGIKPNVTLAREAGIEIGRGVMVNDQMQTSTADVYAVGECVEHRGLTYGLVAPLFEMGKVLAAHLTGGEGVGYEGSVTSTKLKVTGVDVFSAGDFSGGDGAEDIVFRDAARGVYKRIVVRGDKVEGAVLYGDAKDGAWYFQLMKDGADISELRDTIVFGQAYAGGGAQADPSAAVAALADDAEICGCNGVCKGDIVTAITENGLTTLDQVKVHTKASASCGGCSGLVEQVLALTLGDGYQIQTVKPMCGCTVHSHDDVRRLIVAKDMKSIPEVMQQLEWTTPDGCSSCRPALNYYLLCALPETYVDDNQSRFINERVHANIQKDGTFSVVPRMWGGMTSAKELRAIADVVDKFEIPAVKVTGGQRLDLFGVQKKDLPAVWADLNAAGMVSGHAYGKSLRTVKTCAGNQWCRFGTQDAIEMGIALEQMTWGSWTPHKFKMAVSGCPRNCAEATIKDFGVVAVDSGYALHVGGNGGIDVRVTDYLTTVETEEEVLEYAGAYMQIYREEARYLERTAPWVERVGLDHIKANLVEDEDKRKSLFARFMVSQNALQEDPWAKRAEGVKDAHEFTPLKIVA
jgi:nitrite reductase (NADH) large subunit